MSTDMTDAKVGDALFYLPHDRRDWRNLASEYVVSRVGREYLYCVRANGREVRAFRKTGVVCGGKYSSPGVMFRSLDSVIDHLEVQYLRLRIRDRVSSSDSSLESLRAAAGALGVDLAVERSLVREKFAHAGARR